MSREFMSWLNTQTLIGHTAKRGTAWHYRTEQQQGAGNHFHGAVPLDRAVELLNRPQLTIATAEATALTPAGVVRITDPGRCNVVRLPGSFGPDDPGAILGAHSSRYTLHGYGEWLISNSERILRHAEGELEIGTVGLLKGGAVAWAQYEMPGNVTTRDGVEIAPFFAAVTSCDGSTATGYLVGAQLIVCDNTLAVADHQAESAGRRVKIRHTAGSYTRVTDVSDALGLLVTATDRYRDVIDALTRRSVTPADFDHFLARWAPPATDSKHAKTVAAKKQGALRDLYRTDERVTPWTGTAFGVVQAVNTYNHHVKRVVGDTRYGRNMADFVKGATAASDNKTVDLLFSVLG